MSKSAFKVWGKNITFGTLLNVLYPTPISSFDFSVPIEYAVSERWVVAVFYQMPEKPGFRIWGSKSGTKTVSNPDLSTPDELEGDNMHVRKLKSRLIAFGINWDVYDK